MSNGLTKDKECIHCKRFWDCDGKPTEVDGKKNLLCVNYEERKKDGRNKEVLLAET